MLQTPKQTKTVFISDIHAPYHDPKAIHALEAFIEWFKPDDVIFMGDVIDFYSLSHFNKDPMRALKLQFEIDKAEVVIDTICAVCPNANKYFIRGNHEARMQKFLWSKASELSGLRILNVPALLHLSEKGIKYIERGRMTYKGIVVKHGDIVRKHAGYSAKAETENEGMSGVSCHTHRAGMADKNTAGGRIKWIEGGCLCDLNQEYLEGKTPDWQQSFVVGFFKEKSKRYDLHLVEIINGKAMFPVNGELTEFY